MRDHRNLRAFQLADELVLEVYRATKAFPKDEMFGLTSQLRRAAVSIASNIVEGCARQSQADFVRFLDMAFASTREVEFQLSIAARLEYLSAELATSMNDKVVETSKVTYGLLKSLRADSRFSFRLRTTDYLLLQCSRQESNLIYDLRKVACVSGTLRERDSS